MLTGPIPGGGVTRWNSPPSQRDLTVTRITPADPFELDDCTLLHAVTGRGAADTPGSSTQLTTPAVHTHAATNAPDQRRCFSASRRNTRSARCMIRESPDAKVDPHRAAGSSAKANAVSART